MIPKVPVAVAMSGGGRTLTNLIDAARQKNLAYEVVGIISSGGRSQAQALATALQLPLFERNFPLTPDPVLANELSLWLKDKQVAWVALGGFLRKFPNLPAWSQRIVNIHPALLPEFGGPGMYGHHVHDAVWKAGRKESGPTIHFVTSDYDEGAIIAQAPVNVQDSDTPQDLAAKVFLAECQLYPFVLDRLVRGELPLPKGAVFRYEYGDTPTHTEVP